MTKVAYITSGKIGIHRFTYNELIELKKHEIDFLLQGNGPTKEIVGKAVSHARDRINKGLSPFK